MWSAISTLMSVCDETLLYTHEVNVRVNHYKVFISSMGTT